MSENTQMAGKVASLWRYPIKSMLGEELNATAVTTRGLLGDRTYALLDQATSKVASAKNPRKWPDLFDYRAAFVVPPRPGRPPASSAGRRLQVPRGLHDRYADYWQQNRTHTLINRAYCIANPKGFAGYGADCWGLTASDSLGGGGYIAHSPTDDWGVQPDAGLELRLSTELSRRLQEWWLLQSLRPGPSLEMLPLDDPANDPQRQDALRILRARLQPPAGRQG